MEFTAKVRPCFWFPEKGVEAAKFYTSLMPDSYIETELSLDSGQEPIIIEFRLQGTPMMILNTPYDEIKHSLATSISVLTKDQAETDHLWDALLADGGKPAMCGWLHDKYNITWQIVPEALPQYLYNEDKAAAKRAHDAMMTMQKIDIAALEAAFKG
jgi:predicted 3-demethylubiquinone-9 3-methyltransferase (glyoxalase superfamily)